MDTRKHNYLSIRLHVEDEIYKLFKSSPFIIVFIELRAKEPLKINLHLKLPNIFVV